MTDPLQFLDVPSTPENLRIAVRYRSGAGPCIVWLGGFMSDMASTKATALDDWAAANGRACLRFDYSGHGESSGLFVNGTIGQWYRQSLAVIEAFAGPAPILVGSSMGGWISLLVTRDLRLKGQSPHSLVLIAPAVDFTESLMWPAFTPEIRREITENGVWYRPSNYGDPYPITLGLIEDGRKHLLFGQKIDTGCPVHILQGALDPDVPLNHALKLVEHLPMENTTITIIPDGDHRLSRDEDIAKLVAIVAAL